MGSEPTIAITGATLWGNRGAEAMLVTAIGQVRARRRTRGSSSSPASPSATAPGAHARITVIGARPKTWCCAPSRSSC